MERLDQIPTQMEFLLPFPPNLTSSPLFSPQYSKSFASITPSSLASNEVDDGSTSNLAHTLLSITAQNSKHGLTSTFGGPQFLSLHRSNVNPWSLGEVTDCLRNKRTREENQHVGFFDIKMKMKKMKGRRKVREPRFSFKTMSDVDVLDDGYKWRKYGQKVVKNTHHPRSYYRCTQVNCRVKKRVERFAEDSRMVITTYEGRHIHSPPDLHLEDSHAQSQLTNFLW
ncbi:unnamed protein product [Lupinus luteus]|uniref:WRKY domain-containing protein n=1 Tax=Lupinus luteus TaxID=3873 RepID=A0AAV1WBA0_LUPLU